MPDFTSDRQAVLREIDRSISGVRSYPLDAAQFASLEVLFDRLLCLSERGGSLGEKFIGATQLIWLITDITAPGQPSVEITPTDLDGRRTSRVEIRAVLDLLQADYNKAWTTTELARRVALSESALRRAFHRELGVTPRDYLHQVRLMRFEQFVAGGAMSITEAARRVGWASTDYACRVFVRNHGITPRQFRAEATPVQRRRCAGGCVLLRP